MCGKTKMSCTREVEALDCQITFFVLFCPQLPDYGQIILTN